MRLQTEVVLPIPKSQLSCDTPQSILATLDFDFFELLDSVTIADYLLFYEVGEDYLAKRAEFRNAQLAKAWKASERGELLLGGSLASPVDGAVLLFKGTSVDVAENFARSDSYVINGLVKRWYVREWTTVVGTDATIPTGQNS